MNQSSTKALQQELIDLGKGTAGAFIFGIPLLYTTEVWAEGTDMGTSPS